MKFLITNLFLFLSLSVFSQNQATPEDLEKILGNWEGKIAYLDYQTNTPFSMPANLVVEKGKSENSLVLNNVYPNEPKANNSEKIKVTKNGTFLNKHLVTKRTELDNGQIQIQTEHKGKDDSKIAQIRYIYLVGQSLFIIRKEVQFKEGGDWIKRSEYSYKRIQ